MCVFARTRVEGVREKEGGKERIRGKRAELQGVKKGGQRKGGWISVPSGVAFTERFFRPKAPAADRGDTHGQQARTRRHDEDKPTGRERRMAGLRKEA